MDLKQELDKRPDLQHLLFRRGWLVSTAKLDDLTGKFPFYDNWQLTQFAGLNFLVHRENDGLHTVETANVKLALIGHCYNPFTMEHREAEQLAYIAEAYGSVRRPHQRTDRSVRPYLGRLQGNPFHD